MLPASFVVLQNQLRLPGHFSHLLYHLMSKIFNVVFLVPVSYLAQGLFSLTAPFYLQPPRLKPYLCFFAFPQAMAGVSGSAAEGMGTLATLFLTCRGLAYPALRCCCSHPSLLAFPRFYPWLLAMPQPVGHWGEAEEGLPSSPPAQLLSVSSGKVRPTATSPIPPRSIPPHPSLGESHSWNKPGGQRHGKTLSWDAKTPSLFCFTP